MRRRSWFKVGALAAVCAVVGAIAGIAGGAASPSQSGKARGAPHWRMHDRGRFGPPIHAEAVVPKRSGNGFETVTDDNGKLKSRSGNDLTITEGTETQTYRDASISVPGDAKIFRNGKKASIDDLKEGDFVHVSRSPEQTIVMATDANFRPRFQGGRPGFGHGPPGPHPPFGP